MSNTYSKVAFHIIFAVRYREALILPQYRDELQKMMTGFFQNRGQKMIAIYCMPDHVHILISYRPSAHISDLVRDLKMASTAFIKEKGWYRHTFHWQNGYGLFSYDPRNLDGIVNYIHTQEDKHARRKFLAEYRMILQNFGVEYDEKYLFENLDV